MSRTTFSGTPTPSSTVYSIAEQDSVYPAATSRMSPPEQIERAGAYHFLGLHDEAMECLEFLPDALRNDRDINVLRLSILQGQGNWPAAAALAKSTLPARPASPEFYVMGAYAIRRLESIEAAHAFLRHGAPFSEKAAIWWYNLACYECCMGNLERADDLLDRAFNLDESYRNLAENDDDLEAWREALEDSPD
jgi:tetratricopeptide (TPR) repeat protein